MRSPRLLITVLFVLLAVLGAWLAFRAERALDAQAASQTDPCFRYGRFECCLKPGS